MIDLLREKKCETARSKSNIAETMKGVVLYEKIAVVSCVGVCLAFDRPSVDLLGTSRR